MNHHQAVSDASGRARIGLLVLVLIIVVVVIVLGLWGTSWTVPQVSATGVKYELVGYWDAAVAPSGTLLRPIGIAVAPNEDIYVTDARNRVVRLSSDGQFKTEWGTEGNGPGQFSNPIGIAVAPDGSVFVSDYDQDRIQKFTPDGRFLISFGGSGSGQGQFNAPAGLAADNSGFLYVADFYNMRVQQFRTDGSFVRVIGHPGRLGAGALHYPTGVAVTPDGNLVVADAYNYQLQWFTRSGRAIKRVGYHLFWLWPLYTSSTRGFAVPTGVGIGPGGIIHVADSRNHRVVMVSANGEYIADWVIRNENPKVYSPEQIAVSPDGRTIYATDLESNRILVLQVVKQPRTSSP